MRTTRPTVRFSASAPVLLLVVLAFVVPLPTSEAQPDAAFRCGFHLGCAPQFKRKPERVVASCLTDASAFGQARREGTAMDWDRAFEMGCFRARGAMGCSDRPPLEPRANRFAALHDNGVLWVEGFFVSGLRDGVWTRWSMDGEVIDVRYYINDQLMEEYPNPGGECPNFIQRGRLHTPKRTNKCLIDAGTPPASSLELETMRAIQQHAQD
ncbi:MAG: hypothetical protein RLN84_01250 [Rhodospirillaceae bacterium]